MWNYFKKLFSRRTRNAEKQRATAANEPYISVVRVDLDPNNINRGAFELDWNEKFIINLIKAGYQHKAGETDNVMVDRWFSQVCHNVVRELYEQVQADPQNRDLRDVTNRDIGGGRTEVS